MNIDPSWQSFFDFQIQQDYFKEINDFIKKEREKGKEIYPPENDIFNAFNYCSKEKIKVVILGQDPYHGSGQAHGLAFSVRPSVKTPPSLINIYKELQSDISGFEKPNHGYLKQWAEQGVLLLNTALTVEAAKPGSHSDIGWHIFTDHVIKHINENLNNLVFVLWGAHAQSKIPLININKHIILKSPHPSPFSAHRGFLGNQHFSKINEHLTQHNIAKINWKLDLF